MDRSKKRLAKLALKIHGALSRNRPSNSDWELPNLLREQTDTLCRLIRKARRRSWRLACRRLQQDLCSLVRDYQQQLAAIEQRLMPRPVTAGMSTSHDIYTDLLALDEEFEAVTFDHSEQTLTVTTEPIELEGVYLGPFDICLDWDKLPDRHTYRVIAVNPHPAATNETVTHPHVQEEIVCEGEARSAIAAALEQGRLLDFFTLVANLLRTYNSGSPYISLSEWYGIACSDCGQVVHDEERYVCERCEASICSECTYSCPECDSIYCDDCVILCQTCGDYRCVGCIQQCDDCQNYYCENCLTEERCENCDAATQPEKLIIP